MSQYNPIYGELLSSREVSEMTGFTMNQLRNQRQKPETSPFPFVRLGGTSLYRKVDIMKWLEANGGFEAQYVVMEHHKPEPLVISAGNMEKAQDLSKLKNITTENSWTSMATWVTDQSGLPSPTKLIHDEGRRLLAIERGVDDPKSFGVPNPDMKARDLEGYWKIWTYGVRKAFAIANQMDVTDEDIMSIPIGDVPPLKMK